MYKLNDKLNFGKHRGETIKEVINDNPTYIEWAIDTIDGFELDDSAQVKFEQAIAEHYGDNLDQLNNDWGDGHPLDYGDR